MKIAIDVRTVQAHNRTGLWAYTQGMVEGLSCVDDLNDFFVLGAGLRVKSSGLPLSVGTNFKRVILPVPDRNFTGKGLVWNDIAIPLFCHINKVDIFWQPAGHRLPSRGAFKKVITIHDLRSLHLKDFLPQDIDGLKKAVKIADKVICISDFTKRDVIGHLGADEEKVRVIYNGVDNISPVRDGNAISDFKARLGIDKPFLFSLGMVPRKNVERSISAFAKSGANKDFLFVFAGAHGGFLSRYVDLADRLGLGNSVMFLERASSEDLRFLYSAALAFVFPSLFEGFGLPVLEAQICGCPVITSNVSALPEVAGDSALLVDPYSVEEISNAMKMVVYDTNLRASLIEKGLLNAQRFSWERAGKELLEIFSF